MVSSGAESHEKRLDAHAVLAPAARAVDVACMPTPRDQRHMAIILLLAIVSCTALAFTAIGIDSTAVKEVLAIIFPPMVALVAVTIGNERRRS